MDILDQDIQYLPGVGPKRALLLQRDATLAPELFAKSARVMTQMAEETVNGKSAYIRAFKASDLAAFRVVEA